MKNSKLRRALLLLASAVLLVSLSVGATLAYLTSTPDAVVNTFTVGKVVIDLTEAPVDDNGDATTGERVKTNDYHLLPGHEYDKDPTVYVADDSENCYVFVKVDNAISGIEVEAPYGEPDENGNYATGKISDQMTAHGWYPIAEGSSIFYYGTADAPTAVEGGAELVVFETFKINGELEASDLEAYVTEKDADGKPIGVNMIKITAYAIQADGFENKPVADIWQAFEDQEL